MAEKIPPNVPATQNKETTEEAKRKNEKIEELEKLAAMQKRFGGAIRANPDIKLIELDEILKNFEKEFGLKQEHKEIFYSVFLNYKEKQQAMKVLSEQYPDANALYEKIFGQKPKGHISVKNSTESPFMFYFECDDDEDFIRIYEVLYFRKSDFSDMESEEIKAIGDLARKAWGVHDVLSIENDNQTQALSFGAGRNTIKGKAEQVGTFRHEEQHAIQNFIVVNFNMEAAYWTLENNLRGLKPENLEQEAVKPLIKYWQVWRRFWEEQAKNEILAHCEGNSQNNLNHVLKSLTQRKQDGGMYDYFYDYFQDYDLTNTGFLASVEWPVIKALGKEPTIEDKMAIGKLIKETAKKVFREEYDNIVQDAAKAASALRSQGYSAEELLGILKHEPLEKWPEIHETMSASRR